MIVFIEKHFDDFSTFDEIKQEIHNVEIKGYTKSKIPKFKLQLYAFVDDKIMRFPFSEFECDTVTTTNFFVSVHRIINVKVHLKVMRMIFLIGQLEKIMMLYLVLRIISLNLICFFY